MINSEVQTVLRIEPPYGTRLVQHLHHAELLFAKKDAKAVIEWIQNLNMQVISLLMQQSMESNVTPCTNCEGGFIIDRGRTSETFPKGFPMKCPVCEGTSLITHFEQQAKPNDIISDTIPPAAPVPTIKVVKEYE